MKSQTEPFYAVALPSKDNLCKERLALGVGGAGPGLFYQADGARKLKRQLLAEGFKIAKVVKVSVKYTWLILFSAFQLFSLSAFTQVPPIPVAIKRPAKTTSAPTSGSGALSLLSVKAAAIPVTPQILLTWTPTNIVWTQAVTTIDISNGIPVSWLTNRWTNLWEIQERIDNGPWTIKLVTNRPPARLPRTTAGTLHIFRIRSFWDP